MSGTTRVRKIHLDYAGADGLPKPLVWALPAEPGLDKADYAQRAKEQFRAQFPEWTLRGCVVADEDVEEA